jgi:hypothetical protein
MPRKRRSAAEVAVEALRSLTPEGWAELGRLTDGEIHEGELLTKVVKHTSINDLVWGFIRAGMVVSGQLEDAEREIDELRAEWHTRNQRPRTGRERGRPAECEARDLACLNLKDVRGMTYKNAVLFLLKRKPELFGVSPAAREGKPWEPSATWLASTVKKVKHGCRRMRKKFQRLQISPWQIV